jgi:hypothetical protein
MSNIVAFHHGKEAENLYLTEFVLSLMLSQDLLCLHTVSLRGSNPKYIVALLYATSSMANYTDRATAALYATTVRIS